MEFQLTQGDYAEAQLSRYRRKLEKIFVPGMVVLGGALVTLAIALTEPKKTSQLVPSWIFLAALFLLAVLLRSGMLHRMQFNRLRALHEPIRCLPHREERKRHQVGSVRKVGRIERGLPSLFSAKAIPSWFPSGS
jgi:hypothetical protein